MQTKDENPVNLLSRVKSLAIIETYFEFNQLKQLYRQGWLKRGVSPERCESVAEHTLGTAVLAMLLAESCFPELDSNKVLRMALLHDFGEIYAGDFTPVDPISSEEKHRLEFDAVSRVFSKLPQGETYLDLWKDYEENLCAEAKFVHQIDRLEMGLQASIYELQGLLHSNEFFESGKKAQSDPRLLEIIGSMEKIREELL